MEHPMRFALLMAMLGLYAVIIIRLLWSFFAPARKIFAVVAEKNTTEFPARQAPDGKVIRYEVTFAFHDKCKTFFVMESDFQNFREGAEGTLTYRGDRLIDFH